MDRELVVIVPNETAAYDVVRSLKALDDEGSIELYSSTVVARSASGVEALDDTRDLYAPWGTLLGASTGALVGLLAGPAGAAVGAALGGAAGLGGDLAYSGFAGDFVHKVAAQLPEGGYAVVASVWEDWTVPVDAAMAAFGGVVLRQATDDVVVAQIRSEVQALKEEDQHLEAEIAKAAGEAKAQLEAKRAELRAKQAAQREKLRARANQLEESWRAKLESMKRKAAAAKADAKTRREQHIARLSRFAELQKESFRQLFT